MFKLPFQSRDPRLGLLSVHLGLAKGLMVCVKRDEGQFTVRDICLLHSSLRIGQQGFPSQIGNEFSLLLHLLQKRQLLFADAPFDGRLWRLRQVLQGLWDKKGIRGWDEVGEAGGSSRSQSLWCLFHGEETPGHLLPQPISRLGSQEPEQVLCTRRQIHVDELRPPLQGIAPALVDEPECSVEQVGAQGQELSIPALLRGSFTEREDLTLAYGQP